MSRFHLAHALISKQTIYMVADHVSASAIMDLIYTKMIANGQWQVVVSGGAGCIHLYANEYPRI
jgi:hypothetical protein